MEKEKSTVDGVWYNTQHRVWLARTPSKKNLYRGKVKKEAEDARLLYNENRRINYNNRYAKKATAMFVNPVTFNHISDGGRLEGFYEV